MLYSDRNIQKLLLSIYWLDTKTLEKTECDINDLQFRDIDTTGLTRHKRKT